MYAYLIAWVLFIIIIYSYVFYKNYTYKIKNHYFHTLIFCTPLILLSGLRFETDADYSAYMTLFNDISPIYNISQNELNTIPFEWGYSILNSAIKSIFNNVIFFMITIAAGSIYFKALLNKCLGNSYIIAIVYYLSVTYINFEFIQIRWGLALGLLALSLLFFLKGNTKTSFAILLTTLSIHFASLIFILIPIYNFIIKKKQVGFTTLTLAIILQLLPFESSFFIESIEQPKNYFIVKFIGYLTSETESVSNIVLLSISISTIICRIMSNEILKSNNSNYIALYTNVWIPMAIIIMPISAMMPVYHGRIFMPFMLITAVIILKVISIKKPYLFQQILFTTPFISTIIFLYILISNFDKSSISTYKTLLF